MTQHKRMPGIILCTFMLGMISWESLIAQSNFEDVVYLKNGSVIHCTLMELIPGESIRIKTSNNDVILFKMDEVQKIVREESVPANPQRVLLTDENVKTKGFTSIFEFAYASGDIATKPSTYFPDHIYSLGFATVNGYMFNPHLSTGIGIGIQGYDNFGFVPVFVNVRYNVVRGTITPYASFDAGYSFSTKEIASNGKENIRGGTYSNLSIGIKFFTHQSQALAFSFGYNYQDLQVYSYDNDQYPPPNQHWVHDTLENMVLKFSFVF